MMTNQSGLCSKVLTEFLEELWLVALYILNTVEFHAIFCYGGERIIHAKQSATISLCSIGKIITHS